MSRPIEYESALHWILANDDCEWLDDPDSGASVTAEFVADIYGRTDHAVRADLTRMRREQDDSDG